MKRVRKQAGERAGEAPGMDLDEHEEEALRCASCEHRITVEDEGVEVAGRHRHTCVNPAQIVFRIRCFGSAPGCVGHGPTTAEHSWFDGYAWQIALCGNCAAHLGWLFTPETNSDPPPSFAGLIDDRLKRG